MQPAQTMIDRTPQGFTQPLTTNDLASPNDPYIKSSAFGDPEEDQPQPSRQAPVSQNTNASLEDEFEIPAFLRQKK